MTTQDRISAQLTLPSKYVEVYGSNIHYLEAGKGDPILFLHGIPTSCYLWRNIIPHLTSLGRCIAPDLIGCGKSSKPDIQYSILDHIKYIDQFIEKLNLKKTVLIMHGLGSVIGFDYAMRHENNCKGLVFYEAFLRSDDSEELSLPFYEQVNHFQEDYAFDRVVNGPSYIDKIIPQTVMKKLSEEEMNHYREPFEQEGSEKPLLQYFKELPMGDGKGKMSKLIANYSKKLTKSKLPKLMLYSIPGFITTIATAMWAKKNLPHLELIDIGEELHLAQETCPQLIGETISVWLQGVEQQ